LVVKAAVLERMAMAMAADIKELEAEVLAYLQRYLQVYCFEYELDTDANPFGTINHILNGLELNKRFPDTDKDWLTTFMNQKSGNFLIEEAFGKKSRFPSIIEITTSELKVLDPVGYSAAIKEELKGADSDAKGDEGILQAFQSLPKIQPHIRSYHKYLAVVHADGDKIGKYISKLDGPGFQAFSDKLFAFSQAANELIKLFGGISVFIGGDDMLFLTPVAKVDQAQNGLATVFHLVQQLDMLFNTHFPNSGLSFSYGISFTYYKHPLNEARELSYSIQEKAKHQGGNAVAFQLRKHSGAYFEALLPKAGGAFGAFVKLVGELAVEKQFISSLIHKLGFHRTTLELLLATSKPKTRLKSFFDNNFDEAIHQKEKAFYENMVDFLLELHGGGDAALEQLNAALRFVHFLRSTEDEA
jgi:CRISPR-associated protein Cmr2